jgi:hypothetical protein
VAVETPGRARQNREVGTMIRYRRFNRKWDVVGVVVLLLTATLLWVSESTAKDLSANTVGADRGVVAEVVNPL